MKRRLHLHYIGRARAKRLVMHPNLFARYPKLTLLCFTFVAAYMLFLLRETLPLDDVLLSFGYAGVFISGLFYSYGFTSGPATVALVIQGEVYRPLIGAVLGGFGALMSDLLIFYVVRFSMMNEIHKLSHETLIKHVKNKTPPLFKMYGVPILAAIIIASPLPDELGVFLLAATPWISMRGFSFISYIMNAVGIFVLLMIGRSALV